MLISDWSSDVCSSDLLARQQGRDIVEFFLQGGGARQQAIDRWRGAPADGGRLYLKVGVMVRQPPRELVEVTSQPEAHRKARGIGRPAKDMEARAGLAFGSQFGDGPALRHGLPPLSNLARPRFIGAAPPHPETKT